MIVDTLFHVLLFLLAFMILFAVRKVRVRHHPTRVTTIPREHSESCLWMQHLFDGVFDMFTAAFAAEYTADLERKVSALLEDRGFATRAQLKIHSVGTAPPHVVAMRATLVPAARAQHSSNQNNPLDGITSPLDQSSNSAPKPHTAGVDSDLSSPDIGPSQPPTTMPPAISSTSPSTLLATSIHRLRHDAQHQASQPIGPLELEFVCEYSGGASATLDADIPIIRGRQLKVSVSVSELTVRAHCKLIVRLRYGGGGSGETNSSAGIGSPASTIDGPLAAGGGSSPLTNAMAATVTPLSALDHSMGMTSPGPQPQTAPTGRLMADVVVQAFSEPAFSFELKTTASQYGIHNFFGFAMAVKFLILRWVRSKLMAGLRFEVPLPAEWSAPHAHPSNHQHAHYHHSRVGSTLGSAAQPPASVRSKSLDTPAAAE
jgi:hypothetical protein